MKTKWIEKKINYDGSQLRSLYAYMEHDLLGDSVVAWRGPCDVTTHMVDGEDKKANAEIRGGDMLHFIVELFEVSLFSAVAVQRLFAALVREELVRQKPPLEGQIDREGDDLYHFVSDDEFTRWIDEKKFLEWAQVHKGARYGTLIDEIIPAINAGKTVIREVDVQGFDSMRSHVMFSGESPQYKLFTIFILPESTDQLINRIKNRAPISEDELLRRVASMEKELAYAKECDIAIRNPEGKLKETIERVEQAIG